jgi:hypothetical protein
MDAEPPEDELAELAFWERVNDEIQEEIRPQTA